MAVVDAEAGGRQLSLPAAGFSRLPAFKQIGFLVGIAISVALGIVVALWSRTPTYEPLFSRLSAAESGEVINSLKRAGIRYKLDSANGVVLVAAADIQQARIKLATEGLPRSSGVGFASLSKSQGFGVSQFMENARYQHALEEELAQSITSLRNIRSARVHLAIPKQSAFVRNRRQATASIVINRFLGSSLSEEEISGIAYLVASSVNELAPDQVTIVDQKGQLLSAGGSSSALGQTSRQRKQTASLEGEYVRSIENILTPIVGVGKVRAQVNAEVDYTITEQTQEQYDPNSKVMRSEQLSSQNRTGSVITGGIPGALSNQPPGQATAPATTSATANAAATGTNQTAQTATSTSTAPPSSSSSKAIHNFELDKTIRHVQLASGKVTRLSIAVVVDQSTTTDSSGKLVPRMLSPEDENRLLSLAKQAVGFSEARGDTITLVNTPFSIPESPAPLPEVPIWKQPWVWDIAKQVVAGIFLLLLLFLVIRPAFKSLTGREMAELAAERGRGALGLETAQQQAMTAQGAGQPALGAPPGQGEMVQLEAPGSGYEEQLSLAQQMVKDDPKRVAQVVRGWMKEDG
ncbi:MAG TPA: flagellar M-ring protein FliF [Gammaproteobacteria bacterium]|nr:flagellar M-ring protein FliF [Gammaproteobacteria bacterium]